MKNRGDKMTLMEKLLEAGYPKEDFYHHCSDLYIFETPLTQRIINKWFKEQGLDRTLFVNIFKDQITGSPMYDVAFQYYSIEDKVAKGGVRFA